PRGIEIPEYADFSLVFEEQVPEEGLYSIKAFNEFKTNTTMLLGEYLIEMTITHKDGKTDIVRIPVTLI
ncbi:MAG: hypothetical protein QW594_01980, partial [Candidatus Woesearchaeota archaeon]